MHSGLISTFNEKSRAENKTLGWAGQTEILNGHLYDFDTIMIKFLGGNVENCTENGP